MTIEELRELDAWIAEHVMESRPTDAEFDNDVPRYSSDSASAMDVLKKCVRLTDVHFQPPHACAPLIEIWGGGCRVESSTMELAICLFAKKLFSKG